MLEAAWREELAVSGECSTPTSSKSSMSETDSDGKSGLEGETPSLPKVQPGPTTVKESIRFAPKFVLGRELARGLSQALTSGIGYFLMLAVSQCSFLVVGWIMNAYARTHRS